MRLAYNQKEAAAELGVGVKTFRHSIQPELRCVYVNDMRLWPRAELERWLERRSV